MRWSYMFVGAVIGNLVWRCIRDAERRRFWASQSDWDAGYRVGLNERMQRGNSENCQEENRKEEDGHAEV